MATILVVDDEPAQARAVAAVLSSAGHEVETFTSPHEGLRRLEDGAHCDLVISDLNMPEMSGLDLAIVASHIRPKTPVVLLSGGPTLETAVKALDHGVYRYLSKPIDCRDLLDTVESATALSGLSSIYRDQFGRQPFHTHAELRAQFERGIDDIRLIGQPIVSTGHDTLVAYELLMRADPSFDSPVALLSAAEHVGEFHRLGRTIRTHAAEITTQLDPGLQVFTNLHPLELLDDELFDPETPFSKVASRVVLEITERCPLDGVPDLARRLRGLRDLGFQIALDDVGSGYASLHLLSTVLPDVVKLDRSLIESVYLNDERLEVARAITTLCHRLGIAVIGEGVEREAEKIALEEVGVDLLQGYLFGRPAEMTASARSA